MSAANCPETGRQKMIGMMYLFLTAMLAINVSKVVLNAFVVVNESLAVTNETFEGKNEYMYNALASAQLSDPKAVPYYKASLKVKKLAEEMDDYILTLRGTIINAVQSDVSVEEGKTFNLMDVEAKDNYDIPMHIMVGPTEDASKGKARELRNRLDEYRKNLLDILNSPEILLPNKPEIIKTLGDLGIDTEDPSKKPGADKMYYADHAEEARWETSKFDHMPVPAAVAMLTQIENQIKNAEATIINKLLSGIGSTDFKFDTLAAKVIPKSNYVVQGGEYEADLFVAAFSTSANPKVFIGEGYDSVKNELTGKIDSVPVINGMGKLKIPAGSVGPKKYAAMIEVTNSATKEVTKYPLKVSGRPYAEYMVAKPTATISPTKMNVLYIGVDNPIDISVSGFDDSRVTARLSGGGGYLRKKGAGHYIARVKKSTKAGATISVSAKDDDGNSHAMGKMKFRVKNIPKPEASVAKKNGGKIARSTLLAQKFVKAELKNFAFDLKFKVTSFTVSATIGGFDQEKKSNSANITPAQKNIIKKVRKGGKVIFNNIKAKGPDGKTKKLGGIIFKIK